MATLDKKPCWPLSKMEKIAKMTTKIKLAAMQKMLKFDRMAKKAKSP